MATTQMTPAQIIAQMEAEAAELQTKGDALLKEFVDEADAAYKLLGEMNAELDAVDAEMKMLDSDTPPKGGEKYAKLLDEEEAAQ